MKAKKLELIPGNTYSLEQFISTLRPCRTGEKKFIKENGDGFFSHQEDKFIEEDKVNLLMEIVDEEQSVYKYFNTLYSPFGIFEKEIGQDVEDVKSNNIYDKMAARTTTHYEGGFKVKISYSEKPITVVKTYSKDTTLSMRDINGFM